MDKVFNLYCQRLYATFLILVVIPLAIMGLMIAIIFAYGNDMPDWLLISLIVFAMGLSWVLPFFYMSKFNSVKRTIILNDCGIQIKF
jgi:hypothetical protein